MKKNHYVLISVVSVVVIITTLIIIFVLSNKPENFELLHNQSHDTGITRILIDAGHTARVAGGFGPIGAEHIYTYIVSEYLANILDKDSRFRYEISRYRADSEDYSDNILYYAQKNKSKLLAMIKTKIQNEKRGYLTDDQYVDMYSIRHYAIENNFDCLVSIHFDVADKRYYNTAEGFHVLVSPYNRQFRKSFELASTISSNFMKEYRVSGGVRHDHTLDKSIWQNYDRLGILAKGIGFRSLVVIGDVFENQYYLDRYNNDADFVRTLNDIPSVLIEVGYLHEEKFLEEAALRDVAQRIYESLVVAFPEWGTSR